MESRAKMELRLLLEFIDANDIRDGHHFDKNGHEKWRTDAFEDRLEAAWNAIGGEYLRERSL